MPIEEFNKDKDLQVSFEAKMTINGKTYTQDVKVPVDILHTYEALDNMKFLLSSMIHVADEVSQTDRLTIRKC